MREETLRIERVTLFEQDRLVLDNLSLHLFSGEILGLICVNFRGQEAMVRLIEQNIPIHYGFVYLHERQVNAYEKSDFSYNRATVIETKSRLVGDLSVAENIFVLRHGFKNRFVNHAMLENQVLQIADELGIRLDPTRTVRELSFFDRCVVALVKAYVSGSRLVVVRDISNSMSATDLRAFHRLMRHFAESGVSFLYICNHHQEVFSICDRAAIMEDGQIRKFLDPDEMTDQMIEHYCASFSKRLIREEKKLALAKQQDEEIRRGEILILRDVVTEHCSGVSFSLLQGECAVLLDMDTRILEDLLALLSCEGRLLSGKMLIDGYPVSKKSPVSFIAENPSESMILPSLPAIDNLCFLLDQKQPNIWRRTKFRKSIAKEFAPIFKTDIYTLEVKDLTNRQKIDLVYYRILLQRPKLVVCVQPFAQADMYLRSHIISLINRFKKQNITFLILAVSTSDSLYVADRILLSEKGKIVGDYTKAEFQGKQMPPDALVPAE
ncbi:MAG: sugar ABC transporter ATP-binding protein [Candidatus Howiella sp.]|jgi:ribose transport system ATP-binding protein